MLVVIAVIYAIGFVIAFAACWWLHGFGGEPASIGTSLLSGLVWPLVACWCIVNLAINLVGQFGGD